MFKLNIAYTSANPGTMVIDITMARSFLFIAFMSGKLIINIAMVNNPPTILLISVNPNLSNTTDKINTVNSVIVNICSFFKFNAPSLTRNILQLFINRSLVWMNNNMKSMKY